MMIIRKCTLELCPEVQSRLSLDLNKGTLYMLSNYAKIWIKAAGIRALKTICQTAAGVLSAASLFAEVDWKVVVSSSLLSGVISLLTSISGLPEVKIPDSPEAADAETTEKC